MSMWNNRTSWAAAMALAVGMTTGASAADLGGNCCADLEERIAELEATTARKGNRKVSLEISGWLNKTVLFWDDGIRNDVYAGIDNDAAQSRFQFSGMAKISPDVTAGFLYQFGGHGALTSRVDQSNGGDDRGYGGGNAGLGTTLRQANVWLQSARLGRVTLGFASQATDGIAEIDLSRTEVVSGSAVDSWIGGFSPNADGLYEPGRRMLFHFLGNFDGGRDQLIRYDSPTIAGFILSASLSGGSLYPEVAFVPSPGPQSLPFGEREKEWDVALRYAGEWNGLRFAAGIGYHVGMVVDGSLENINALPVDRLPYNQKVTGSTSLLHVPSGLFLTVAAGWMQILTNDIIESEDTNKYVYVKSGLQTAIVPLGQTVFYGEYYRIEKDVKDCTVVCLYPAIDVASQMWGAGVVQHIDAAAMELYAAYRYYDSPNGDGDFPALPMIRGDFHMGQVGMRIRF
jgi:hypothetical protein